MKRLLLCVPDSITLANQGTFEINLERQRGTVAEIRLLGYSFNNVLQNHETEPVFALRMHDLPLDNVLHPPGQDSRDVILPFSTLAPMMLPNPISLSDHRISGFSRLKFSVLKKDGTPFTYASLESVSCAFWFEIAIIPPSL